MTDLEARYEVVVVGGGNAGLAAAISAAQRGAKVAILEKAGRELRGGNTYFTEDFRFGWESLEGDIAPLVQGITPQEIDEMREIVKPYTKEQFYGDVMRVCEGKSDPALLHTLVDESLAAVKWLRSLGHQWTPCHKIAGKSMAVVLNGGGARLSDHGFAVAQKLGVVVRYGNVAMDLLRDAGGRVIGVRTLTPEGFTNVYGRAVILASGGFQANAVMRTSLLGPEWDCVKVRGVPFDTGDGMRMAWDIGAQSYGNLSGCHATPQDMNRPPFSVRTQPQAEYRRHDYPWSILVNVNSERFVDEGSDFRPYTYAKTGRVVMKQPQGIAFQICDAKTAHLLYRYTNPTGGQAQTLEQLADMLGLEPAALIRTINEYNAAVQPGEFDHRILDGKCTRGLAINKSNWAMTIDTPPFHGYGMCCGITFTFGGLRIDTDARVLSTWEAPIPGLYACGEIVGGLFYSNYPGGSGMTQGAVFGRRAGANAAVEAGHA